MSTPENRSTDEKASIHDEKHGALQVHAADIDVAAALIAGEQEELDPEEAARILRKIDIHILPLMCLLYLVQFIDKTTLGLSAILGIIQGNHLTVNEYNWLGTIFYLAYLIFQFPQNLALQRFPIAKWMSINILIWAVALTAHAGCHSFGGLMAVRFVLGMCEGSITPGFMLVSAMFYTRKEQTIRVGYWYIMSGFAIIFGGFISFGVLHIKTTRVAPWQWLFLITGIATIITAVLYWFLFPDSPTTAWFLTPEERVKAVLRIRVNQTGVENKTFKREQMIEALYDPKTWLFALFAALNDIPNSLGNQLQLIVASFGFTILQTTLLSCVNGVIEIFMLFIGCHLAARYNNRGLMGFLFFCPCILAVILVNTLSWKNQIGLLFSVWLNGFGGVGFVTVIAWISSTTAGHTKRITTNSIVLIAYCIGNAVGPFMWLAQYKPRNHIPWAVIGSCYAGCMATLLVIRWTLKKENERRDAEPKLEIDPYDNVYVERLDKDGNTERVKIPKEFLDLTDRQNRDFRYVL